MTTLQYLMIGLAIVQPLDWHSTYLVIRRGGREANGVLVRLQAWLYDRGHTGRWTWLTVAKVGSMAAFLGIAFFVRTEQPVYLSVIAGAMLALYVGVIANNYRIADKLS